MKVIGFIFLAAVGLVLIALGLTVPAHLRAIDARIVLREQPDNPSVVDEGLAAVSQGKLGPAILLLQAAQQERMPETARLQSEVERVIRNSPADLRLGGSDPYLASLLKFPAGRAKREPIVDLLIARESRERVLQLLNNSRYPNMGRLLAIRNMTNTVHFPPVRSASGQPLEAAILLTGMLLHEDRLTVPLRDRIEYLASRARWDNNLELLEQIFLDLLSAGRHLTWVELTDFLEHIQDPLTLQRLANQVALAENLELSKVFTVVHMSSSPATVAGYLNVYEKSGLADLSYSLRGGKAGLRQVLDREQRVYRPSSTMTLLLEKNPIGPQLIALVSASQMGGLIAKLFCLAMGALLIALAVARAIPAGTAGIRTWGVPELVFTLGFLAVALLLTEPFLGQQNQTSNSPLQWKFPMTGGPLRAAIEKKVNPMVDTLSLVSLVTFLFIQVVIYIFCRRKLGEIQKQVLPSKLKLRLLENEEHLFDAGLYVGFVGTVMSLVCVSIGLIKPSLMAAYSSTSFGIIFVTVLKIFYLRPYRKQLIIETEEAVAAQ
jgi:hypothetical protein